MHIPSFLMEGPREKILENGPEELTDAELLSLILRTGQKGNGESLSVLSLAESVLNHCGDLSGILMADRADLEPIPGIGPTKAAALMALKEMTRRLWIGARKEIPIVNSANAAYLVFSELLFDAQETLAVAYLNPRLQLIRLSKMFRGTQTECQGSPREIVREGLRCNASSLVIAHNHPSGDPEPSEEDKEFTRRLSRACETVGIQFLDHLVLCRGRGYFSFADARIDSSLRTELGEYYGI